MNTLNDQQKQLHTKILNLCMHHKSLEAEIILLLGQIEKQRVFLRLGFASLFEYTIKSLGLSEANAYAFILVARKSREIKTLQLALQSQKLSVSKAARLVSVLNPDNAEELVSFASTNTSRQIDQRIAELRPRSRVKESIKPLSSTWMKLECSISQEVSLKLSRAQSLLSTRKAQAVDLNETLHEVLDLYLKAHDPVEKAKRALEKVKSRSCEVPNAQGSNAQAFEAQNYEDPSEETLALRALEEKAQSEESLVLCPLEMKSPSPKSISRSLRTKPKPLHAESPRSFCPSRVTSAQAEGCDQISSSRLESREKLVSQTQKPIGRRKNKRTPLKAHQKHAVHLKDQGRCTFINAQGERCVQERWLHIHHIKPVKDGGSHDPSNLRTLCATHHDLIHQMSLPIEGQISWLRETSSLYSVAQLQSRKLVTMRTRTLTERIK